MLDALLLKGCVVTIDAMGCQKAIAAKIAGREADYVLMVKNNQASLAAALDGFFDGAGRDSWEGSAHTRAEWVEKDHGRIETRRCVVAEDVDGLVDRADWPGARTLAMVEAIREVGGTASRERRYYISSLGVDAARMGEIVRGHWGMESVPQTHGKEVREEPPNRVEAAWKMMAGPSESATWLFCPVVSPLALACGCLFYILISISYV